MVEQNIMLCHPIYCNIDCIVVMENTTQVNCVIGTSDLFNNYYAISLVYS